MLDTTTGTAVGRLFSDDDVEEKDDPSPIRLPKSLWGRLSRIAELETASAREKNPHAKLISRNSVVRKVLSDFADAYEQEASRPKRGH